MMAYDERIPVPTSWEVDAFSPTELKSYETRLRRTAARRGLRLERSRLRDPQAYGYGKYRLTELTTGEVVANVGHGLELRPGAEKSSDVIAKSLVQIAKGYVLDVREVAMRLNMAAGYKL